MNKANWLRVTRDPQSFSFTFCQIGRRSCDLIFLASSILLPTEKWYSWILDNCFTGHRNKAWNVYRNTAVSLYLSFLRQDGKNGITLESGFGKKENQGCCLAMISRHFEGHLPLDILRSGSPFLRDEGRRTREGPKQGDWLAAWLIDLR